MVSTRLDLVNKARELGVEYLSATGDALFKELFVQGLGADPKYKKLLVRAVTYVIGRLDSGGTSLGNIGDRSLLDYSISGVDMIQESVGNKEFGRSMGEKKKKRTNLPELPEVDFAAVVGLRPEDESCIVGIEMQVEDQHNIGSRLQDYGTRLFRLSIDGISNSRKVFEVALCMWDAVDNVLGTVFGIKKSSIARRGEICLDTSFPLCCAQIFLGELIFSTNEIIDFVKEHVGDEDNMEARANAIKTARERKRNELKGKFELISGYNIDESYAMKDYILHRDMGYSAEDFEDQESKERFVALENYELLEFLSLGNLMTHDIVNYELVSTIVKELYNKMEIKENNIILDPHQANDIYKSSELVKTTTELHKTQKIAEIWKRLAQANSLSKNEFIEIVGESEDFQNKILTIILKDREGVAITDDDDQYITTIQKTARRPKIPVKRPTRKRPEPSQQKRNPSQLRKIQETPSESSNSSFESSGSD